MRLRPLHSVCWPANHRAQPVRSKVRHGMTLVEVMIYACLFSMILAGLSLLLSTQAQIDSKMQRLDTLNAIRQSSNKLSLWLEFGTHLLYPPVASDTDHWFDKLLFADSNHEKRLLYIDPQRRLKMQTESGSLLTLADHVIEFGIKRLDESLVVFRIKVQEPKGKKFFIISNSIQLRNAEPQFPRENP